MSPIIISCISPEEIIISFKEIQFANYAIDQLIELLQQF